MNVKQLITLIDSAKYYNIFTDEKLLTRHFTNIFLYVSPIVLKHITKTHKIALQTGPVITRLCSLITTADEIKLFFSHYSH